MFYVETKKVHCSFAGASTLRRTFTWPENWMVHRRVVPLATIHTPILARASDDDNERSRRGNPFDLGADFVFRSEWSRRVSAARSGTHRRTCSPDATIKTHSDMLIRFENKCNGNPPLSLLPPALPASPARFSFPRQRSCSRAIFIASRTLRNYPAAKSAPPTRVPHVCARFSHDMSVSAPRSRGPFKKQKEKEKKMMRCTRETETVESFQ